MDNPQILFLVVETARSMIDVGDGDKLIVIPQNVQLPGAQNDDGVNVITAADLMEAIDSGGADIAPLLPDRDEELAGGAYHVGNQGAILATILDGLLAADRALSEIPGLLQKFLDNDCAADCCRGLNHMDALADLEAAQRALRNIERNVQLAAKGTEDA